MKTIEVVDIRVHTPSSSKNKSPHRQGIFMAEDSYLVLLEEDEEGIADLSGLKIEAVMEGPEPFLKVLVPAVSEKSTAPLEVVELASLRVPEGFVDDLLRIKERKQDVRLTKSIHSVLSSARS